MQPRCPVSLSDFGIRSVYDSTTNLVVRNHTTSCTTNYSVGANTRIGPILSGTGNISSTSPWANFTD